MVALGSAKVGGVYIFYTPLMILDLLSNCWGPPLKQK